MQKDTKPINKNRKKYILANQNKHNSKIHRKTQKTNSIAWLEEHYNSTKGENSLWAAVITQAMMDALSRCKKSDSQYNRSEAMRWLTGNSKDFIDVCLLAGLNPDYVRQKAKKSLISPSPWRAEAGKGKRYAERKKYREKQRLKKKEETQGDSQKIIFINQLTVKSI